MRQRKTKCYEKCLVKFSCLHKRQSVIIFIFIFRLRLKSWSTPGSLLWQNLEERLDSFLDSLSWPFGIVSFLCRVLNFQQISDTMTWMLMISLKVFMSPLIYSLRNWKFFTILLMESTFKLLVGQWPIVTHLEAGWHLNLNQSCGWEHSLNFKCGIFW